MDKEIAAGYKQTEVGVIPVDWNPLKIKEITTVIGDGIHSTPVYSKLTDYFFINGNNIVNGSIVITTNTKRVGAIEYQKHKKQLNKQTVFLSINGTIGNVALYDGEKIILGKSAAYLNVKNDYSKIYFYYSLQTNTTHQIFEDGLTGSTIKNLGLGTIRNTLIPIPPTKIEQTAIATALSDVDALISSLDNTLAKKRLIKQGTMQELLTGKKRLAGFSGKWEVKLIGDFLKVKHGKSQKEVESTNGEYPILGTGGVMGYTNHFLYDKPSVLIGRKGTIDKPQFMNSPFWTVDTLFYTEIFSDYSPQYIYYIFLLIDWYSYNEASGVPSLNAKTIENIEIIMAPTKTEQTAIAQTLSDIDNEIETLETRRTKTLTIKQGMMQELLTGKTRLI